VSLRDDILHLLDGAQAALEAERDHINDLNVYPVPDGDTGTNLALTLHGLIAEVEGSRATTARTLSKVVARGSLMAARGNSGVILSQVVRGACDVLASRTAFDTGLLKEALDAGCAAAYRAVKQPVEGTMLTVIRAMAEAAGAVSDTAPAASAIAIALDAGATAVEATTEQLDVLRRAGVVDAGGYGLLVIARGLAGALGTEHAQRRAVRTVVGDLAASADVAASRHVAGLPADDEKPSRYRYCTSFLVRGEALDGAGLERFVAAQGDSWLVVGDAGMVKVHVHTDHPGTVLSYASAQGEIDAVEVNDMHEQTRARTRRLTLTPATSAAVAVVAGEGNKALFRELGCDGVVDGGQSMNPSAAQIMAAIEEFSAEQVVVLPNNKNIVLTAEQAATLSGRPAAVVPTLSIPAGLSALVAFDPSRDSAANAAAMEEAATHVRSAEITHAVRDSRIDGTAVRRGQVIGLVDGRLTASGDDLRAVFSAVLQELARGDIEVVTVLTALNGFAVSVADLEAVAGEACPEAEVEFREGGQPLYPILIGAE